VALDGLGITLMRNQMVDANPNTIKLSLAQRAFPEIFFISIVLYRILTLDAFFLIRFKVTFFILGFRDEKLN
jgi:hypothetical protein